jgi:type I restriction enzyme M protein
MQTSETALLFMQVIMRRLRRAGKGASMGGRAAVVVPDGTLFADGVAARIKAQLLQDFNLHTVVRLPNGVFAPYTPIPTNLLFFDRSGPSKSIWYYEIAPPEGRKNYSKTKPIQAEDFQECASWWPADRRQETERAWRVDAADLIKRDSSGAVVSVNLDVKNPHTPDSLEHLRPEELIATIEARQRRVSELLGEIANELGAPRP